MKYIVCAAAHDNEPEEYEAPNIYGVVDQLLELWVDGDMSMPGAFAFLAENGRDFGITDEEVDESTTAELIQSAADAIREIILDSGNDEPPNYEKLALFLDVISSEYHIDAAPQEEGGDERDSDSYYDPSDEEDRDRDFEMEMRMRECRL